MRYRSTLLLITLASQLMSSVHAVPAARHPHNSLGLHKASNDFAALPLRTLSSAFRGSLVVQSSVPVSLIGLRFSGAEFSTLPIVPITPVGVPVRPRVFSFQTIGG